MVENLKGVLHHVIVKENIRLPQSSQGYERRAGLLTIKHFGQCDGPAAGAAET
jgi:hypothetical protein